MRNLREMIADRPMRGSRSLAHRTIAKPMALATGFRVDLTDPIGQKWTVSGGAAKVGEPTAGVRAALGGMVRYQTFEKGAIFFSEAFGPALVSVTLFAKWSKLGAKLQDDMGPPTADSTRIFAGRGGSIETATFQKGAIVARGSQAFEVHGGIYQRWRALGGLGSPISDEEVAPGGAGRRSRFLSGDIYWKSSTNVTGSVGGPIRDQWEALGGPTGLLGYPITDETPVMRESRVVGRFVRFEHGVIYWSSSTGAHEVHGAILSEWENSWGGATGALGFPISDETSTPKSGGRFNDFEQGCLVWHPSGSPFVGVHAFTRLELFVDRFQAKGRDGGIADQDLYVKADIRASTGEMLQRRYPDRGVMGTGREVDEVWLTVPKVQSTLAIDVKLEGWDSDTNIPFDDDDRLGAVQERLTIDNLWGLLEDRTVWRGDFMAVFRMRNPMPFDGSNFRRQMYWRFENFKTAELSYDQYAQTFRDVSPSEFDLLQSVQPRLLPHRVQEHRRRRQLLRHVPGIGLRPSRPLGLGRADLALRPGRRRADAACRQGTDRGHQPQARLPDGCGVHRLLPRPVRTRADAQPQGCVHAQPRDVPARRLSGHGRDQRHL